MEPRLQYKIFSIIKLLKDRKRIITYPSELEREPQNDIEWLEIALKTCMSTNFHGLVLGPKVTYERKSSETYIVRSDDVLESGLWSSRNRTEVVSQNTTDYKKHLAPIMKHAKSLSIIDPYLSTEQRYIDTVKICLDLLGNNNVRVHIHCGVREGNGVSSQIASTILLDDWVRYFSTRVPPYTSHRIKVFVWKQIRSSQRFHDRAIITDQCGIGVEGGLDCYTPNNRLTSTTFSLLDEVVRQTRLRQVDPANRVFQLLNSREIV